MRTKLMLDGVIVAFVQGDVIYRTKKLEDETVVETNEVDEKATYALFAARLPELTFDSFAVVSKSEEQQMADALLALEETLSA